MRLQTSVSLKVRGFLTHSTTYASYAASSSFHTNLLRQKTVSTHLQYLSTASKQSYSEFSKTLVHFTKSQQRALHLPTGNFQRVFYHTKLYNNTLPCIESARSCKGSLGEVWSIPSPKNMPLSTSTSVGQAFGCQGAKMQTKEVAREIFNHAVNSVLPHTMIEKNLFYDAASSSLRVASREYCLQQNIHVIGFGKAVMGMARALEDCVGDHVVGGVLSIPVGSREALEKAGLREMLLPPQSKIRVMEGAANNLPDEASHQAAQEIARVVEAVGADDILIVLISGGGSALLPAPEPPLTLTDTLTLTRVLARSGVNIQELNMVRKQLDRLKGGGIARLARPAQVLSLILSDIIGDDLSFIASGPTVPNTSTLQNCLDLFSRFGVEESIPASVRSYVESKVSNCDASSEEDFSHVQNVLIGTNKIACEAACSKSSGLGFLPYMLSTELSGEAKSVGQMFALLAKYIAESLGNRDSSEPLTNDSATAGANSRDAHSTAGSVRGRLLSEFSLSARSLDDIRTLVQEAKLSTSALGVCIVAGGETTVAVTGNGRGGRNQEMAIAAGIELHNLFQKNNDPISQDSSMQNDENSNSGQLYKQGSVSKDRVPVRDAVFLSAGTDGQDGPTTAAGGLASLDFVSQANQAGLDVSEYLADNDSFTLLSKLDRGSNLVITGLTGTNVMDLQILLVRFFQS